jgi:hypothetical protein
LYKNYRQITEQRRVWNMLSSWKRINLSYLLVFDSSNPRNYVKVARLLGRPNLELLEVDSCS